MPKNKKDKKLYAVINLNWKADDWEDCFYEQIMAIRGANIFGAAIFLNKKEAEKFKIITTRRKSKVVEITVNFPSQTKERSIAAKRKKGELGYSDIPLTPNTHTLRTQPEQRKV